jgi:hypothetical protein
MHALNIHIPQCGSLHCFVAELSHFLLHFTGLNYLPAFSVARILCADRPNALLRSASAESIRGVTAVVFFLQQLTVVNIRYGL